MKVDPYIGLYLSSFSVFPLCPTVSGKTYSYKGFLVLRNVDMRFRYCDYSPLRVSSGIVKTRYEEFDIRRILRVPLTRFYI